MRLFYSLPEGVFAGGKAVTGASIAAEAIGAGRSGYTKKRDLQGFILAYLILVIYTY